MLPRWGRGSEAARIRSAQIRSARWHGSATPRRPWVGSYRSSSSGRATPCGGNGGSRAVAGGRPPSWIPASASVAPATARGRCGLRHAGEVRSLASPFLGSIGALVAPIRCLLTFRLLQFAAVREAAPRGERAAASGAARMVEACGTGWRRAERLCGSPFFLFRVRPIPPGNEPAVMCIIITVDLNPTMLKTGGDVIL